MRSSSHVRFCASDLWTRQALQRFPQALQEKDFVVPGENLISHDGRRNLTDLQETSQWLGGVSVAKGILEGLLGNSSTYLVLLCYVMFFTQVFTQVVFK